VFILGIPRSGTTLLQSLLDGHPQLLVDVADSRFCSWYRKFYARFGGEKNAAFDQKLAFAKKVMISHIFSVNSHYYRDFLSHISIEYLESTFSEQVKRSSKKPKDYLESYFHALGSTSGELTGKSKYWVDKTLNNEFLYEHYSQWWPESKFIFVVRDPRAVYATYRLRDKKQGRKVTPVDAFAASWSRSVRSAGKIKKKIREKRWLQIQYEALVSDPEGSIDRMVDFLQIEKTASLFQPTKGHGRAAWGGNPARGNKENRIFTSSVNRWQTELNTRDISRIESLLKTEMAAVQYTASTTEKFFPALALRQGLRDLKYTLVYRGI